MQLSPTDEILRRDAAYDLDDGPGEHRIGLLALANDQVIQRDFARLVPSDVLVYTTRIAFGGECNIENLAGMMPRLTEAAALLNPEIALDAVAFGCTSGTIAIGRETIRSAISASCPGACCLNPVDAACAAFAQLGVRRVGMLTPYMPEIATDIAEEFLKSGISVVERIDLGIAQSRDISRVTPRSIADVAASMGNGGAEGLFIACTDFRSLEVIAEVEASIGVPVVTSNQALAWQCLQVLGIRTDIRGVGGLLESGRSDDRRRTDHPNGRKPK